MPGAVELRGWCQVCLGRHIGMHDARSVDGSLVVCHRACDVMSLNLLDLPLG